MKVTPGSTDVTTYISLVDASDGSDAISLTPTDFDLQYVRSGATPAAKVDASALGATNSAHADNSAIEIDATDQPGLYRVDWPDAAFAAGVREVVLTVKHADCRAAHLRVEIETIQTGDSYAIVNSGTHGNPALKTLIDTIDTVVDAILDDTGTAGVKIAANALDAAAIAADAGAEIRDAVWAKAMTELTGIPAANGTALAALTLLFMALRNKRDTSETEDEIHDDAGSVIGTATLSDDGTTFTKGEYA